MQQKERPELEPIEQALRTVTEYSDLLLERAPRHGAFNQPGGPTG